jgi:hypothetical protein
VRPRCIRRSVVAAAGIAALGGCSFPTVTFAPSDAGTFAEESAVADPAGSISTAEPTIPTDSSAASTAQGEGGNAGAAVPGVTEPDATVAVMGDAGTAAAYMDHDGATDAELGNECVSDPAWCDSHCGSGPDNCGRSRTCNLDCPTGTECGSTHVCVCQPQPDWCAMRCGQTKDNCNNPVDCGGCDGGTCAQNACGCVPESVTQACNGLQCGQVKNNCGQTVNCGISGTASCPAAQVCTASGACCAPNNAAACNNKCGVSVVNNCGQTVECPITSCAGPGAVCFQNQCCMPVAPSCMGRCGGAVVSNNCGQSVMCMGPCPAGEECSSGSCCAPAANACANKCNVTVMDGCGMSETCSCGPGQMCNGQNCCTPNGSCSGKCLDNCGQMDTHCCGNGNGS